MAERSLGWYAVGHITMQLRAAGVALRAPAIPGGLGLVGLWASGRAQVPRSGDLQSNALQLRTILDWPPRKFVRFVISLSNIIRHSRAPREWAQAFIENSSDSDHLKWLSRTGVQR